MAIPNITEYRAPSTHPSETFCSRFKKVAEGVSRIAIAALAGIAYLLSFTVWIGAKECAKHQWERGLSLFFKTPPLPLPAPESIEEQKPISVIEERKEESQPPLENPKQEEPRVVDEDEGIAVPLPPAPIPLKENPIPPQRPDKSSMSIEERNFQTRENLTDVLRRLEKQKNEVDAQQKAEEQPPKDLQLKFEELPAYPEKQRGTIGIYPYGLAYSVGRRGLMEDESWVDAFEINGKTATFSHLCDGHGGVQPGAFAPNFVKNRFNATFNEYFNDFKQKGFDDTICFFNAFKLTFAKIHDEYGGNDGTTALTTMIWDNEIWTACVGDSRAIFIPEDSNQQPIQLSEDAKPNDPRYKKTIENRGGKVHNMWGTYRINGYLAVARAIGDKGTGAIDPRPKITKIPQQPGLIVQVCDGIIEGQHTTETIAAFIRQKQDEGVDLHQIASNLVTDAFRRGSGDNLSVSLLKIPSDL